MNTSTTFLPAPAWPASVVRAAQRAVSSHAPMGPLRSDDPCKKQGETAEEVVLKAAQALEAAVYLCEEASSLNHDLKTDLVIEVGDCAYCYQIKSSAVGAQKFLSQTAEGVVFNKKRLSRPGLIIAPTTAKEKLQLANALAATHQLCWRTDVKQALELAKKLTGSVSQRAALKLFKSEELLSFVVFFGFARYHMGEWVFRSARPTARGSGS